MLCILATNNPGKAREIRPMFEAKGLELITLADLGLAFEPREDGATFAHNAMQKASETVAFLSSQNCAVNGRPLRGFAVLADDSGLEIDAMDGAPGVDSALFMGRDTPYNVRCRQILTSLADVPDSKRTARFKTVLACAWPGALPPALVGFAQPFPPGLSSSVYTHCLLTQGVVEGQIAYDMRGEGGFGYDPIFYYPPYGKTLAELTPDEKNKISHRGQAIQQMIGLLYANKNTGN